MPTTQDIVQKLWSLCDVLRDDGITYQDYVTELTWMLFLKMAQETNTETQLPEGYRWNDLVSRDGIEQLNFYKKLLLDLGTEGQGIITSIFADASTSLRQPRNLKKIQLCRYFCGYDVSLNSIALSRNHLVYSLFFFKAVTEAKDTLPN